jgi:hypothetical protein
MVAVPLRCDVPVCAATTTVTLPEPLRFVPLFTVSQVALRDADHSQPLLVVTVTVMLSPAAGDVREVGDIVNAQGAAS